MVTLARGGLRASDEDPVNYSCMSCGANYAIPDARVARAGDVGLRVRCTRCRAIMGISSSSSARGWSEDVAPPREGRGGHHDEGHRPLTTGVWKNPFADVAAPAALSGGGQLQGAAGVSRAVTGVFDGVLAGSLEAPGPDATAQASSTKRTRVWFCAIEGRPRGPYTADELLLLAHKGRIRSSTLLWRPSSEVWQPLRRFSGFDVAWLLDAVQRRKQHEARAEQERLQRRGIVPVRLERRVVRTRPVAGADADADVALRADDLVFEAADDGSALPSAAGEASPFLWRAPDTASHAALARPRSRRRLVVGAAVGLVLSLLGGAALLSVGALGGAGVVP